ncbi:MAG: MarR family winged helix-turn-helix transcriptional regulator [Jatrophihabitantaceae bacterium]
MAAVADVVDRLSMWLRRQVPAAVSSSTITTLDTLNAHGPLRVSELADREAISQPGMTTLVNRLEAAGHAERVADPTDGRAALVRITATGRAILAQRHTARTDLLRLELQHLDDADRAALAAAVPAIQRLIALTKETVNA